MISSKGVKIFTCLVTLMGFIQNSSLAQPSGFDQIFTDFYQDGKSLVSAPFHWQKNDRVIAISFLAVTSLSFATDEDSREMIVRNRTDFSNRASDFFRPIGDKLPFWALGGMYVAGLVLKDQKAKDTGYLGLKAILITQGITTGLKYSFGRARPFADKGAYYFKGFDFSPCDFSLSLPSGHATTAFAFASVIAHQYPQWWVKYPVYLLATGVAWSRLNDDVHFSSDAIIGAGIGYFVGEKIVHRHQEVHSDFR